MPIPSANPCECQVCECNEPADGHDGLCYECRIGMHVEADWSEFRQDDDLPFQ